MCNVPARRALVSSCDVVECFLSAFWAVSIHIFTFPYSHILIFLFLCRECFSSNSYFVNAFDEVHSCVSCEECERITRRYRQCREESYESGADECDGEYCWFELPFLFRNVQFEEPHNGMSYSTGESEYCCNE